MTSDLYGRLTDAARTAVEIIRRERARDLRGVVELLAVMAVGLPPPDDGQHPG